MIDWQALATWALVALYALHWFDMRRLRQLVDNLRVDFAFVRGQLNLPDRPKNE